MRMPAFVRSTRRAADAAPGVLAVLTGRDMLDDGLQAIPHSVGTRHPADITLENTDGSPPFIPPHFPMTTEEARHCGEIVAMVVATSLAAAKDGAELVAVDYEPLPAVTHSVTAVQPGAPIARGDASSNISIDAEVGDPAATNAAFARAAHIVKFETWVQRIAGVPMEPRAATGTYDPDDRALHALCRDWRRRPAEAGAREDPRRRQRTRYASSCTRSAAISEREARSIRNLHW